MHLMSAGMSPFVVANQINIHHSDDFLGCSKSLWVVAPIDLLDFVPSLVWIQPESTVDEMMLLQLCYEFVNLICLADSLMFIR